MKQKALILVGTAASASLLAGCAFGGGDDAAEVGDTAGPVEITFQSLAFQDTTVAATDEIVAAWNQENPDIQVNLRQGSWNNVQDQLVTQFAGGTAPDVIHYESSAVQGFADQGYLADLEPHMSSEIMDSVSDDVLGSVTSDDGELIAAPTLLESYVVYANTDAFEEAGVDVPDGDQLNWDELRELAAELSNGDQYGVAWGLSQPTKAMMSTSLGFGGTYFNIAEDGSATIDVGDEELAVAEQIHGMAFDDSSMDPVSLTQGGSDVLPGFIGGDYAMYIGGNFLAQQITESASEDFNWTVLPPLAGAAGPVQAANPQTVSVSAQSEHVEEAAQFIDYFMQAENQAQLALGDWLIPASADAREEVRSQTADQPVWSSILESGETLASAPYQEADNYPEWDDQHATSAFQQYFADSISRDELQKQLTEGWESTGGQ